MNWNISIRRLDLSWWNNQIFPSIFQIIIYFLFKNVVWIFPTCLICLIYNLIVLQVWKIKGSIFFLELFLIERKYVDIHTIKMVQRRLLYLRLRFHSIFLFHPFFIYLHVLTSKKEIDCMRFDNFCRFFFVAKVLHENRNQKKS